MDRIGVTCGDPAGIGPEIIAKCKELFVKIPVVLIGPEDVFKKAFAKYASTKNMPDIITIPQREYKEGVPSKNSAWIAYKAICKAVEMLKKKELSALVTAPVSKRQISLIVPGFSGHTSFLAESFKVSSYAMCGYSKKFKVVLITEHLPLKKVVKRIKKEVIIEKVVLFNSFLRQEIKQPKIGVFSYNPHAGEINGEEEVEIKRAIAELKRMGIEVEGPLSSDSLFFYLERYNGFVAMYHDQGMIPAKLISQGKGVNVTLGLPFVRTSPLHGTGFDIAGKNIASAFSMAEAIKLAYKLCKRKS